MATLVIIGTPLGFKFEYVRLEVLECGLGATPFGAVGVTFFNTFKIVELFAEFKLKGEPFIKSAKNIGLNLTKKNQNKNQIVFLLHTPAAKR